jgi:hypothetical protein
MTNNPIFLIETDLNYEYVDLLNDVIKYITVIVVIHVLLNYEYGRRTALKLASGFFTDDFLNLLIFIILGFMAYNLVVRKLVVFQ